MRSAGVLPPCFILSAVCTRDDSSYDMDILLIKTDARHAINQSVVRILLHQLRLDIGGLTLSRTGYDRLLHPLHIPARAHEFGCQPIEKLRMRRPLSLYAEVLRRL